MSSNWPLKTGSKVEIHGLKSKPQLNGKKGTIVGKMKDTQPAAKGRASTAVDAATSSPCATAKAAPASARDVASAPPKTAPIPAPADHSGGGGSSRWHVQVDFEGGTATCVTTCPVVAIKASNLTVLGECTWCKAAKEPKLLLRCGRCRATRYCGRECQAADWHGIGKEYTTEKAYTASRPAHKSTCQKLACCFICLDNEDYPLPIQSGCGCRGDAGTLSTPADSRERESGHVPA